MQSLGGEYGGLLRALREEKSVSKWQASLWTQEAQIKGTRLHKNS